MKQLLRQRITTLTNKSTAVDITTAQVKAGETWHITHLALANASGEQVMVAFGFMTAGVFTQQWIKGNVSNNDAFGVMVNFFALEGDKIDARVTGTADIGPVTFTVSGEFFGPEPVEIVIAEIQP